MGNSSSNDAKSKSIPKSPRKTKFLRYRKSFAASKGISSTNESNVRRNTAQPDATGSLVAERDDSWLCFESSSGGDDNGGGETCREFSAAVDASDGRHRAAVSLEYVDVRESSARIAENGDNCEGVDSDADIGGEDFCSDPLFTASATSVTPYYSPEEELDAIFAMEAANGKENSTPNNAKPNSFTVVKHKKVELSPTFPVQRTSAEGKGK